MFRYLRFYISPIVMALLSLAIFFGSYWLWLPGFVYIGLIAVFDQIISNDTNDQPYQYPFVLDFSLYLSLPAAFILFFSVFWALGSGSKDVFDMGAMISSVPELMSSVPATTPSGTTMDS